MHALEGKWAGSILNVGFVGVCLCRQECCHHRQVTLPCRLKQWSVAILHSFLDVCFANSVASTDRWPPFAATCNGYAGVSFNRFGWAGSAAHQLLAHQNKGNRLNQDGAPLTLSLQPPAPAQKGLRVNTVSRGALSRKEDQ